MNIATVLFVFLTTVAPVRTLIRCSECDEKCTKRHIEHSGRVLISSNVSHFITEDTSERMLSPWTYVKDFNASRLPQSIWSARCEHRYCRDSTLSGFNYRLRVWNVVYSMRVYYKEACQDGGHYRLVPGTLNVNVGCTCIKPRLKAQ
ncbi:interleukin-17C-like [Anguilla rostrata]|uniref:interleukin-17C-like n=1 Tax=Anguilla rostrata TaxID=7938 RepID=UPI0030D6181F